MKKCVIAILLITRITLAYIFTGFTIKDLEGNGASFASDSKTWTASRQRTLNLTSVCNGTSILGGYGVLGNTTSQNNDYLYRNYAGLPSHTMVYFTISLWAIDSWDQAQNDRFSINIDSTTLMGFTVGFSNFPSQVCGKSNYKDLPNIRIFGSFAHIGPILNFKFTSRLDQDSNDESFGIRDLSLLFVSNPILTSNSLCGRAAITIGGSLQCSCPEGQYRNASGACSICDSSCKSCFGLGTNQCYECNTGYSFDGENCFSCDSTCSECSSTGPNNCLACNSGDLLFYNGSCLPSSSCTYPLVQTGGGKFCGLSCTSPSDYLYWDNTCVSTCDFPLMQRVETGINLCDHPCLSTEYVLMNGSCITSCDLPLSQRKEHQITYCLLPCSNPLDYYHQETGTCSSGCTGNRTLEKGLYLNCIGGGIREMEENANAYPIVRLLHPLKYIDSKVHKFQRASVIRGNNILSLRVHPAMLRLQKEQFLNLPLPVAFQKPNHYSSFLANFFDDIILLSILLFFGIFFKICQVLCSKRNLPILVLTLEKLSILTRWNLPLMILATNMGDIIFFAVLEFISFDSDYSGETSSLVFSILMFIIAISFLVGTFLLVYSFRKAQTRGLNNRSLCTSFVSKWQNFQVLFGGGYGESVTLTDSSFLLIYCIRQMVPMIIAACLFNFPIIQAVFYNLISVGILLYIFLKEPIRKTIISFINLAVIEGVILLANFLVLLLVAVDLGDQTNETLNTLIIVCNHIITFQAIVFLIIRIALVAKPAYKLHRQRKIQERNSIMFELIFIPFQQGMFCFELLDMRGSPNVQRVVPLAQNNPVNSTKERDLSIASPSAITERSTMGFPSSSNRESPFLLTERNLLQKSSRLETRESERTMTVETTTITETKKSLRSSPAPINIERDLGDPEASFGQEPTPSRFKLLPFTETTAPLKKKSLKDNKKITKEKPLWK